MPPHRFFTSVGLWDKNISIVLPFALLGCAHWAILWRAAFTVEAAYSQQDGKCVLVSENHTLLTASFFMSASSPLVACYWWRWWLWCAAESG